MLLLLLLHMHVTFFPHLIHLDDTTIRRYDDKLPLFWNNPDDIYLNIVVCVQIRQSTIHRKPHMHY